MTEAEFRIKHSEIIEYYQLIEMRLKSICAVLIANEDKSWFERLDDYEFDPMGVLIRNIRTMQELTETTLFSINDFNVIDDLREARNYWAHECFGGKRPVCFKNGKVKQHEYARKIENDHRIAVEWDERLAEILHELLRKPLVTEG